MSRPLRQLQSGQASDLQAALSCHVRCPASSRKAEASGSEVRLHQTGTKLIVDPPTMPSTNVDVLALLERERELILSRTQLPGADPLLYDLSNLKWYLKLSRNWAFVVLEELSHQTPPARLLEVGAGYAYVAGAACELGWRVSAVDVRPIPNFSGIFAPGRSTDGAACNICVDPLPYDAGTFDAVLFLEVLEHLPYSPAPVFREMRRVLKPRGRLYLTTPHPGSIGRMLRVLKGENNEPEVEYFVLEDDLETYKGQTFFRSGREHRLWTAKELLRFLPQWGFRIVKHYYYNTMFYDSDYPSAVRRVASGMKFATRRFARRSRFLGGGMFFLLEADAQLDHTREWTEGGP